MITDALNRRNELHLARRFWHILCGLISLSFYYVFEIEIVHLRWLALGVTLIAFSVDLLRIKSREFNKYILKVLAPIMRKSEIDSFSGLPFYALGICVSLFFYEENIAILSILFLVFADPIASIVGVKFGKDKILPNKSLQGTIGAFLTCLFISFVFSFSFSTDSFKVLEFSILAGIIGSISELLSAFNIDDNLTIPIVSGAGMTILNLFIPLF